MFKKICSNTAVAVLLSHSIAAFAGNTASANAFNPALSFIMVGTYGNLQHDPAIPVTGFAMNPVPGHAQGFNIGESELGVSADIDPQFRGVATISLLPDGSSSVENAFVQTTALENGVNLKFGRFFSGLGYLNEQHSHTWDFVDQPLVYSVLWGDQLKEDGVQLKWLAPTDLFIELGGEIGKGSNFPGTNTPKNGSGASTLFAHFGDDIGIEQSWRAGLSLHQTRRVDAVSTGVPDLLNTAGGVSDSFTGDSKTAGLDFVWKYSRNGNFRESYLKVQSEYFRRKENGLLTYDMGTPPAASGPVTGSYTDHAKRLVPAERIPVHAELAQRYALRSARSGHGQSGRVPLGQSHRELRLQPVAPHLDGGLQHQRIRALAPATGARQFAPGLAG